MTEKNKNYPLKHLISSHNIVPQRKMGQNFLFDFNILRKIANTAGSLYGVTVIEVGPGPGNLTQILLELGAKKVIAIEKDRQFLPVLEKIALRYPNQLEIIQDNALLVDFQKISNLQPPVRIISNLPYNIGTRLFFNWITSPVWPPCWESMTLMFQKEVGQRIIAQRNDPNYGRLSVLTGWRTKSRIVFDIPPHVFFPSPKITSSLVNFIPHLKPIPCCLESIKKITQEAFGKRRKTLRQSLKNLGGEDLLAKAGIKSNLRAENLSVEEFCHITNIFSQKSNTCSQTN
ncbi:MAG: 16S rRNA (adenine(1518)-N(6)/adenine(1519)-N(6))-dimethyltransferase [Candidatus Liberibacter europaeus]|uniref:Ribosomal RNA small subunit methyltransferase A n=1 Tax=Candidatus Liberibacter europaeus TaxID=744859 RepID=A0A2T4VXR6_9HYPH|nr:16S rRNA (adenine(1518)-N(6)/adenine(1519)-N(6))-dimethyltransferase [Candidatus Liberibacter europaeus]PTL86558.1 MAG: 16S rRNA (adenine(1518)-N(6)/adenine(1519)-N(6))-dimethyltransferase [Candidatus Liberibacter europaeus]